MSLVPNIKVDLEHPKLVYPQLANLMGMNEAIVFRQIYHWLEKNQESDSHIKDGKVWVYSSYKQRQANFIRWSESTIKRTLLSLEKQGFVITGNYNKMKMDKTKWYTIDFDLLKTSLDICAEDENNKDDVSYSKLL